jgi:hypothetical protein
MHPDVEWHVAFRLPDLPPDKTIYVADGKLRRLRPFDTEAEAVAKLT